MDLTGVKSWAEEDQSLKHDDSWFEELTCVMAAPVSRTLLLMVRSSPSTWDDAMMPDDEGNELRIVANSMEL